MHLTHCIIHLGVDVRALCTPTVSGCDDRIGNLKDLILLFPSTLLIANSCNTVNNSNPKVPTYVSHFLLEVTQRCHSTLLLYLTLLIWWPEGAILFLSPTLLLRATWRCHSNIVNVGNPKVPFYILLLLLMKVTQRCHSFLLLSLTLLMRVTWRCHSIINPYLVTVGNLKVPF